MPSKTARSASALLAIAALGAGAAGCGGGDDDPKPTGTRYSADQVVKQLNAVTGDPFEVDYRGATGDMVGLDTGKVRGALRLSERYGYFTISVAREDKYIDILEDGRPKERVKPDASGIRWVELGSRWSASKTYGRNVILRWTADTHAVDERFKRLDRVLASLGKNPDAIRRTLPAAERPCSGEGIDIAGDTQGTCRDADGRQLTIVNAGEDLKQAQRTVRIVSAETVRTIRGPYRFMEPLKAKGRFVAVKVKLTNTGNQPLRGFYEPQLRIGQAFYDRDSRASSTVAERDTFPLQPGESGTAMVVFDLPTEAAAKAGQAALMVAGGETSSVEYAESLGALRVGDVTARPTLKVKAL